MGILDRFFGKATGPKDDLLVQVVENNRLVVMDRDLNEYRSGKRTGSVPSQAYLDEILRHTTSVHVYAGGSCLGKTIGPHKIAEIKTVEAVLDLATALQISSGPESFGHCGCLGGPSLILFSGQKAIATLTIHHGHTLRWWGMWRLDATFLKPHAISFWLIKHGVHLSLLRLLYRNKYLTLGTVPVTLIPPAETTPIAEQLRSLAEELRSFGDMKDGGADVPDGI